MSGLGTRASLALVISSPERHQADLLMVLSPMVTHGRASGPPPVRLPIACPPVPSSGDTTPVLDAAAEEAGRLALMPTTPVRAMPRRPGLYSVCSARQTVWRDTPKVLATADWDWPLRRSSRMAAVGSIQCRLRRPVHPPRPASGPKAPGLA